MITFEIQCVSFLNCTWHLALEELLSKSIQKQYGIGFQADGIAQAHIRTSAGAVATSRLGIIVGREFIAARSSLGLQGRWRVR